METSLAHALDDKETFKSVYRSVMEFFYGKSVERSNMIERYYVLCKVVSAECLSNWKLTSELVSNGSKKQLYYFSLEFLMGRMLTNNLMAFGAYDIVKEGLADLDIDLNEIEDYENDAGLGNGGLGRLAACFLDSLASNNYSGNGTTIRYKNGLFKQLIINNEQVEVPDQWLRLGYPWEIRKPGSAVNVKFFGDVDIYRNEKGDLCFNHKNYESVLAVPYDMPIVGGNTMTTNTLRMWSAEPSDDYPKDRNYADYLMDVENICLNLYPEDYSEEGKYTRIKQEYFFVAAGLATIVKEHLKMNPSLDNFAQKIVIQLNDTHPALAIPELMRIFMDEHGYDWKNAYDIVTKSFAYTNHTVLQEALEKWPVKYIKTLLPRIYLIIEEIDNQYIRFVQSLGKDEEFINATRIICDDNVRMANLSIIGSFSVNGVAKIHSQIIVESIFKKFYELYPEKFNNKTNGITHRRWLLYSNKELVSLIEKYTNASLSKNINDISLLMDHIDNPELQEEFLKVKFIKKQQLSTYLKRIHDIDIDPNSIFDVQAKRLHAYKRQLLNIMYVISLYHEIKRDPSFKMPKTTFIFAAKAASNYTFAKNVIKLINCVKDTIANDPEASKYINVVFIPNYSVSIAEKLMPAADVSEQISTAGKEASGTGNMKFMMNGAVTLGTMDGANIEIKDLVGEDNMVIFGLSKDEVSSMRSSYKPFEYYKNNEVITEIIDSLIDGTFANDKNAFKDIADEFLLRNDEYMLLADFVSYKRAHDMIYSLYQDKHKWAKICLINIAKSAYFSSDRTIDDYVKDIWHLDKLF